MSVTLTCPETGERLDVCAARACTSRAQAARLIREGQVTVNGAVQTKPGFPLSAQLKDRVMEKHYRAVVEGVMRTETGRIDAPIGRSTRDRKKMAIRPDGRNAVTEWRVLRQQPRSALLDVHILTGRTHQIRVHMASIGHPVLGDPIYGHPDTAERLMLHAYTLRFIHPGTGREVSFTAPCPFSEV